jgi:hypothetical protein
MHGRRPRADLNGFWRIILDPSSFFIRRKIFGVVVWLFATPTQRQSPCGHGQQAAAAGQTSALLLNRTRVVPRVHAHASTHATRRRARRQPAAQTPREEM